MIRCATFACLLALCGFALCRGQNASGSIEATLCDLYQHADQYTGKIVKVRGGSVNSLEIDDILHDSQPVTCPAYMRIVVVFPDQIKPGPSFQLVRDESYKKLEEALHYSSPIHIDATYVGRFDAAFYWRDQKRIRVGEYVGKGYGKKHRYDGRIVLQQVFDVWAMPLPRL